MNSIIKTSLTPLAAAVLLVCGNAVAQDDPVSRPDIPSQPEELQTPGPAEPWQPNAEDVRARPEQVEEAIDEVLDPESDPSETEDSETDSLDTDRINSGPPTDDRLAGERIDSTIEDEGVPDDVDELENEEAAEDF